MGEQVKLTRAYIHNGVTYGPGVATLPDDEQVVNRIKMKEQLNQADIIEERRQLLSTLPQGHPMRALIEEADEDTAPEQAVAPVAVGAQQPNPRRTSGAQTPPASPPASPPSSDGGSGDPPKDS